jgi:hydrogenase maturation protease
MPALLDCAHPVTPSVTDADYACDTLILGIGNLLWADEGFGIRAMEALHADWCFAAGTRLLDGGTQGLYLLPFVESCRKLLILDAVDYGLPGGTLKVVQGADVPAFMGAKKMSLHQTGFQEVLAVAALRGWQPENIVLIGMQPAMLEDYGGSLSEEVKAALPDAIEAALIHLAAWGVSATRREKSPDPDERLTLETLTMAAYEAGRPDAQSACRWGDGRFVMPAGTPPGAL